MPQIRTPPLYATGQWSLKPPFAQLLSVNAIYICKAIRSFDDLKLEKVDIYGKYYEIRGITQVDYQQDVTNLANIITLMSDTAPTIHVPDTYILSYPDTTVIPYRHVVLSVDLGAVPDTLSLEDIQQKIGELTLASLGIETQVKVSQAGSISKGVDQLTHRGIENNRLARIKNNTTVKAQLLNMQAKYDSVLRDNAILIDVCRRNNLL